MIVSKSATKSVVQRGYRDILALMRWRFQAHNGFELLPDVKDWPKVARACSIRGNLMWNFWHCAELSDRNTLQVWINPCSRAQSPRAE
jgi:hypothetical protein